MGLHGSLSLVFLVCCCHSQCCLCVYLLDMNPACKSNFPMWDNEVKLNLNLEPCFRGLLICKVLFIWCVAWHHNTQTFIRSERRAVCITSHWIRKPKLKSSHCSLQWMSISCYKRPQQLCLGLKQFFQSIMSVSSRDGANQSLAWREMQPRISLRTVKWDRLSTLLQPNVRCENFSLYLTPQDF